MKGILAIYRREMSSYFVSPVAYVVIGLFLFIAGFYFYNDLTFIIQQTFMAQMQGQRMGAPPEFDVPSIALRRFLGFVSTVVLFLVPMLTMGVYAEERKRGTMELLMTSPLTELQIVLGKFLAALTLFIIMIAPTFIYQVIVRLHSEPALPWKVLFSGYLGVLLLGAVLIALGTFISALTESQIVAAVITFVVFLTLLLIDFGAGRAGSTLGEAVQYLSILRHFDDFTRGVIDTTNLVFYLSLTALGIFLTLRTLDSMRWRNA